MEFYTSYGWAGEKYEQTEDLPLKEIAKRIKAEINEKYPDVKVSIRSEYYSGGCGIDIKILSVPFSKIINDSNIMERDRYYTPEAKSLLEGIQKIADQYRYSDSDGQIDYFSTNFHCYVCFDSKLTNQG